MHIVVNGGLTEGRHGHEKGTAKAMRYIVAGSALTLCVIMTGCGCGQKKDRSCFGTGTEDQYHTGTITNTGTGYVDAAAVTSNGDISMVNLYLAENPSAVTNSTDTGAGDANTTDASNMQSQDQSEDTSGSSDEGGDNEE